MDDDLETELKKLSTPTQSIETKIFQYSKEYSKDYISKISDIIKKFQININNLYCDGNIIKFCNDIECINDRNYRINIASIIQIIYDEYEDNVDNEDNGITFNNLDSIIKRNNFTNINFIYFLFNDLCFSILNIITEYNNLINNIVSSSEIDVAFTFLNSKIDKLQKDKYEILKLNFIKENYKKIIIPIKYIKILSYFKDDLKIFITQDKKDAYQISDVIIKNNTKGFLDEFLNNIDTDFNSPYYIDSVKNIINKILETIEFLDLDENINFEYNYFPLLFDELKKYRALLSIINNIICGKIEFLMSILNKNENIKLKPFIITQRHIVNITNIVNISNKDNILYTKNQIVDNPFI